MKTLKNAQREDVTRKNFKLTNQIRESISGPAKRLLHEWKRLQLEYGFLWRKTRKTTVVALEVQNHALKHLHDHMGHVGTEKFINLAKDLFYWPYMKKEIETYNTKKCPCIKQMQPVTQIRAPITTTAHLNGIYRLPAPWAKCQRLWIHLGRGRPLKSLCSSLCYPL